MTAPSKEGRREPTAQELYGEFLDKKAAYTERVLREAQRCLVSYAEYTRRVSEWNAYISETSAYVELFRKIAEPMAVFAGFARYHRKEPEKYGAQLRNTRNSLDLAIQKSRGIVRDGVFWLPPVTESRELEQAESFRLSDLKLPEPSFEEMELLVRPARPLTKARQEELRELHRRIRNEQKANLCSLKEKQEAFAEKSDYLQRKLKDREKHFLMKQAVREVYPAARAILWADEGNWMEIVRQGQRISRLWENVPGNRICLIYYEDGLPEELQMEFQRAGEHQLLCPGLYWREEKEGKTVYERIMAGWYREHGEPV